MQVCELFESDYARMATYLRMVEDKLLLLNPRVQAPATAMGKNDESDED